MSKTARLGLVKPGHGINVVEGSSAAGAPNEAANLDAIDTAIAALQDAAGGLQFATVNITTAQLKALSVTRVPAIPAPGANKIIVPAFGAIRYKFGTIPFTLPDAPASLLLALAADAALDALAAGGPIALFAYNAAIGSAGFFDQSKDMGAALSVDTQSADLALLKNQPVSVMFSNGTDPLTIAELTAGDGTARIIIAYYVMDVS